jgi:CRP-like cAMP-binding protein
MSSTSNVGSPQWMSLTCAIRRGTLAIVMRCPLLEWGAYDNGAVSGQVRHSLVSALAAVPDFSALDDRTLLRIVGASANLVWIADSVVFEKGSASEALYVILSGRVRITDGDVEIATLEPGDFFGELSLLLHTRHSKSATAVEDTELMVLPKESFQELLASNADLADHFRRKLESRIAVPQAEKLS